MAAAHKNYLPKVCLDCGTTVYPKSGFTKRCKPCAMKAAGVTGDGIRPKPCAICGSVFKPTSASHKYCDACSGPHHKRANLIKQREYRSRRNATEIGTEKLCTDCGLPFAYRSGPQHRCRTCQNEFNRKQTLEAVKRSPKRHYWNKTMKENQAFGKGLKPAVLARDGNACRKCGATEKLAIHHIDGMGKGVPQGMRNNTMDNLVTLCTKCHSNLHAETDRCLFAAHPETVMRVFTEFLHSSWPPSTLTASPLTTSRTPTDGLVTVDVIEQRT